jgi:hypothetical protein
MGIQLLCNGESYSCKYVDWIVFREEIANAAIRYLRTIYNEMTDRPEQPDTDEPQQEDQTRIEKILEYVEVNNCATIPDFIVLLSDVEFLNFFIYFELGGVFALLHKNDDEGYYTVGNSLDIEDTMELIEPHIIYDDVKNRYNSIKKVFQESVMSRRIVVFS